MLRAIQNLFQLSRISIEALRLLHCCLLKTNLDRHDFAYNHLIFSASSVSLLYARTLFDNSPILPPPLFAWNTLMRGYSKSSNPGETIKLFADLLQTSDESELRPDGFTYPFVIKSCGRCLMLGFGGSVHSMVVKAGFASYLNVNNTLLTMYGVCGAVGLARKVFDEMPHRDVVSWSSLIAAYVDCGLDLEAPKLFKVMQLSNVMPNSTTFISLLSACTNLLNVRIGKCFHSHVLIKGIELYVGLGTSLLQMYAKSGHLTEALHVFSSIPEKNLQCWTIMISSLAEHGCGKEALSLFTRMEKTGLSPDSMLFSAILSACSHSGLVHEGRLLFDKMGSVYNIMPTVEHYGCMVDLFCRAGLIKEAYRIIANMPLEPNSVILRSYINGCKEYGSGVYVDKYLVRTLLNLEPCVVANYVVAANLSSAIGYCDGVKSVRNEMKLKGLKKIPGCSLVEV